MSVVIVTLMAPFKYTNNAASVISRGAHSVSHQNANHLIKGVVQGYFTMHVPVIMVPNIIISFTPSAVLIQHTRTTKFGSYY